MEENDSIDGTATISPDQPVVAGTPGSWTLTYTVGEDGIQPGGAVRLTIPKGFTPPQMDHPGGPGFVSATSTAPKVTFALVVESGIETGPGKNSGFDVQMFLDTAPVHRREQIMIVYGDLSGGSLGAFARLVAGEAPFRLAVQSGRDEVDFRPLKQVPLLTVTPAEARRISVIIPSLAEVGKPFPVYLLHRDIYGNVVHTSENQIDFKAERGELKLPSTVALKSSDAHEFNLRAAVKTTGGPCLIRVVDHQREIEGVSNPLVPSDHTSEVLLWGDLHGHTTSSDGTVSPNAYFSHARDKTHLDFAAVTDHLQDSGEHPGWEELRSAASSFNEAGRFIPLIGFEEKTPSGGHRNIYCQGLVPDFPEDLLGPAPDDAGPNGEVVRGDDTLVIPHPHGRTTWATPDLKVARLAEIYSCWGNAERWGTTGSNTHPTRHSGGTIQAGLAHGLRFGFVAGSDTHTGFPGSAPGVGMQSRYPGGLTAVYADAFTRPAFWVGLKNRRCYATTGARIILDFEIDGYPLGSEIDIGGPDDPLIKSRAVAVRAYGSSRINSIDIIRNNSEICSYRGDNEVVRFRWVDSQDLTRVSIPRPACKHPLTFYYVRVRQEDGEMAWSSPIWMALTYLT